MIREEQFDISGSHGYKGLDLEEERTESNRPFWHKDKFGWHSAKNPLQFAAHRGNLRAVQLLLEEGADPNPKVRFLDECPLYDAILAYSENEANREERFNILKLLLEKGADCNARDDDGGLTPFLDALECRDLECIKLLMEHGADVTEQDDGGRTVLHYAAKNRSVDVIRYIMSLYRGQGLDIDSRDMDERTALHYAADRNQTEVCEILLRNGANVNSICEEYQTPLTSAVGRRDVSVDLLRKLLEYGANVNDKAKDKSALQIASYSWDSSEPVSKTDAAKFLIQQIVRMEYLNLPTNECDREIIEGNDYYREYSKICLQEFQDMKLAKFYNNVSIHDIFMGSEIVISNYAKNEDLIKALESGTYEERFPIYFTDLENKFHTEIEKQRLRRAAAISLSCIFKFNDPSHIVNQTILSYMKDEDLKFLEM